MKKVFALVAIILVLFLILTYWSTSSTDKKFETSTIENFEDLENIDFREFDSVLVSPSTLYQGNFIKELMQGANYRKAWAAPIKLPIVFLDTLKGGMKIVKEGGGKQTHSLKLLNPAGIMYTLRSVVKDPDKLIPDVAETLGLENIIVDGISGQHPYGAILAARLADIAGVMHTNPNMVFVPKQDGLGNYNEKYGNRIYLLEYETESKKNWTNFNDVKEIVETDELQELKLELGDKLSIDKDALIRARLFDLFIGDWDRHAEQWGWILQEKENKIKAIPMAGDRDNAFFKLEGVLPTIITNKNIEPLVRPFEEDIDYMEGLVYPFDRYFLINTTEHDFIRQAEILQNLLTDERIEATFKVWPEPIVNLDKTEIFGKLKSRRNKLKEYASSFHAIIQEQGKLTEALKGSDDVNLENSPLLGCFECK
ncbi:hypothetical protein [Christiangramia aquimixticola]|uniref:hypothetical protein n=1 Tax=Christiangramia aquimixticola TaxID=1697558 RepID=UPI003AA8FDEF